MNSTPPWSRMRWHQPATRTVWPMSLSRSAPQVWVRYRCMILLIAILKKAREKRMRGALCQGKWPRQRKGNRAFWVRNTVRGFAYGDHDRRRGNGCLTDRPRRRYDLRTARRAQRLPVRRAVQGVRPYSHGPFAPRGGRRLYGAG